MFPTTYIDVNTESSLWDFSYTTRHLAEASHAACVLGRLWVLHHPGRQGWCPRPFRRFCLAHLASKQTLYAIGIESVVPTTAPEQPPFGMQKLNGEDKPVQFFSVGRQAGRTLVIYSRRKGVSVVRVYDHA